MRRTPQLTIPVFVLAVLCISWVETTKGLGDVSPAPTWSETWTPLIESQFICAGVVQSVEEVVSPISSRTSYTLAIQVDHLIKGELPGAITVDVPNSWLPDRITKEYLKKQMMGNRYVFFLTADRLKAAAYRFTRTHHSTRTYAMLPASALTHVRMPGSGADWDDELEKEMIPGISNGDPSLASFWLSILIAEGRSSDTALAAVRKLEESEVPAIRREAVNYLKSFEEELTIQD